MISVKLAVVIALLVAATVPAQRAMAQSVPSETAASVAAAPAASTAPFATLPLRKHTDPSFNPALAAQSQETATPAPVEPAAPAAPAKITVDQINAMMKRSNPLFNPCGGWRQLLTTYAAATNCSLDAGQFTLGVNYAATYIPIGTQLTINGVTAASTTFGNQHSFPAATLSLGLGGLWTLLYTPPEHSDLHGYNGNVDNNGTTNQMFGLRNMFFFNRCFPYCGGFGLSAVNFYYKPPTGSEALRGIGPSYTVGFSTSVTVAHAPSGAGRWIINLWDPVTFGVVSSQSGGPGKPGAVQWGTSSTLLGTAIWIHHSWRLNTSIGYLIPAHQWVFNVNPNYLLSRRWVVGANYGGAGIALETTGAPPIYLGLNNTTRPRFLDVTLMYLVGPTYGQFHNLPEPPPGD
jgi:hypothetical protein